MNLTREPLASRLEKVPKKGEIYLDNESQLSAARKFARDNRRHFVVRPHRGKILLWRAT